MIFSSKHVLTLLIGASFTPLSIAQQVIVVNLSNEDPVDASGSAPAADQGTVGLQSGAECSIEDYSFKAHEKAVNTDLGIIGCPKNKECLVDETSVLGGCCVIRHDKENIPRYDEDAAYDEGGVVKSHRDLAVTCQYPNECTLCAMDDASEGNVMDLMPAFIWTATLLAATLATAIMLVYELSRAQGNRQLQRSILLHSCGLDKLSQ